ncbi:uncharacterized protein BO97DRAFT_190688 [Aspergillus homomorphus CBS 101889]|uniref:Uncharacterized protein n=1 Tax=Aspergillus homomorphus (strain CBS 101889) TaxID=1450537 RepID=A0A395HLZ3_ASPHC|nr:hypothetical protein BO97DRAFT_190688 [Aspergillus homomorphus CBS 101889]RAL08951.1 hypothetical protein BO97DRAFT_190688 [Aspergillus homomorphus CBS 101889]
MFHDLSSRPFPGRFNEPSSTYVMDATMKPLQMLLLIHISARSITIMIVSVLGYRTVSQDQLSLFLFPLFLFVGFTLAMFDIDFRRDCQFYEYTSHLIVQ